MLLPFKWNLLSGTFTWYYLFFRILQNEIWKFLREGAPGSEMIENDSKYPTHLTPSRFPLVIVRASVIAPMKVTPTSRVKMAFGLAWDQAQQCGKEQKPGSNRKNIGERSEPCGCLRRGKGRRPFPFPEYLSADFARHFFFFSPTLSFFTFFPPMRSLVRGYLWINR